MDDENIPNLRQLDEWIREGRAAQVRAFLPTLAVSEIHRSQLVEYADLARRVQLPHLIIHWLRPLIRSEKPVHPPATTKEQALYALALSRIGIFKEATNILRQLKSSGEPEVFYYLGLIGIEQWDFLSAFSPLKTFVKSPGISEYQRTVGLLNLGACYVGLLDFARANEVLNQLLVLTDGADLKLLRANTYELLAQNMIFCGRLQEARDHLANAAKLIGHENYQYEFFIRKWQAIANLFDKGHETRGLHAIRDEAVRSDFSETIRECDFFKAVVFQQDKDLLKVYFGSHFKAYRQRILKIYKWQKPVPNQMDLTLGPSALAGSHFELDPDDLEMPRLVRSLFQILLSDSYRSFPITEIFGQIYDREYFNPLTSTAKVEQLICRLRQSFTVQNIPFKVQVSKGRVSLIFTGPVIVRIGRKRFQAREKLKHFTLLLFEKFAAKSFSSAEVVQALGLSERSARRHLKEAVEARRLSRERASKGYRYICKAA